MLALVLDTGRAFQPVACSGVNIPFYSAFGVGYRELARMYFKYAAVQLVPLLLCCGIGGVVVAWLTELSWWDGALHGLRAGLLIFSARYALLVFNFSGGTNDSSRGFFRSAFLILTVIGLAIVYLVLGLIGLFLPHHLPAFGLTLLAVLFGYGVFRAYGWFYHKNRFDLMSLPRQ
jgi:hypothetical protein